MILKINPNILFFCIAIPFLLLYKGWIDSVVLQSIFLLIPYFIMSLWFYEVINFESKQRKHLITAILYFIAGVTVPILLNSNLDLEKFQPYILSSFIAFVLLHLILVYAAFRKLSETFPERTKLFMAMELFLGLVAIINITGEISKLSDDKKSNQG